MATPKRCILNVANGHAYPRGQARLLDSLKSRYTGEIRTWNGRLPEGAPPHDQEPYAFKLFAMEAALKEGFDTLLWLDAAVWAVKDLTPVFEIIEGRGHFFFHGGATLGQRCSDSCLRIFAEHMATPMTRDQAFQIPLMGGTVYGLCFKHENVRAFYDRWWHAYRLGAFRGAAINDIAQDDMRGLAGRPVGRVSEDPRVQGHCHDESCATIIAHQLGMESTPIGRIFTPFSEENAGRPDVYLVSQGL